MAPERRAQILLDAKPDSWIAFSEDESTVVGYGATYRAAVDEAQQNGERDPVLIKTPVQWNDLVLLCV